MKQGTAAVLNPPVAFAKRLRVFSVTHQRRQRHDQLCLLNESKRHWARWSPWRTMKDCACSNSRTGGLWRGNCRSYESVCEQTLCLANIGIWTRSVRNWLIIFRQEPGVRHSIGAGRVGLSTASMENLAVHPSGRNAFLFVDGETAR